MKYYVPFEIHLTLRIPQASGYAQTHTRRFTPPAELSFCSVSAGLCVKQRHSTSRPLPVKSMRFVENAVYSVHSLGGANPAVNTPRPSRGTRIESCDFIVLIGDP